MATNTYLISVKPKWADAFFLDRDPKTIELRKGNFGASLKPGNVIAIYATMPVAEVLGTVRVSMRELLPINELWRLSQQGKLARVSESQFKDYYVNQESGIGIWVEDARLLPKPIPLYRLREAWGANWNSPQTMQKLSPVQVILIE
jgi:predicted transcriptional regulator